MSTLPEEPEKPLYSDCCGGGSCCPCVWDVYFEKLAEWREAKQAIEQDNIAAKDNDSD